MSNRPTPLGGPEPAQILLQTGFGYMASSALNAVARLRIADLLKEGPRTISDLARETLTSEDILYRVLRALASLGIFTETEPRTFANSAASDFLRADHPNSLREMTLWICNPFHLKVYADMTPTMLDGKSAIERLYQKPVFDVLLGERELAQEFHNAMTGFSALVIPTVLEVYDFEGIGTLADIAGGHGFVITAILQKYPHMKGILFDLPQVVPGAAERAQQLGLSDRLQVVAGDFWRSVPPADAYIMKHIIHDWDDEKCLRILSNCAAHLKTGGKVILIETVLAPGNDPHIGKWADIEMFMGPGGRERTESEFRDLFERAGFRLNLVIPTNSGMCVVEAVKR